MKKLSFIFLFALIFIPARAEDVEPVIITPFYESLTYAVKPEIKNWWQGGSERMAALGGILCVLPDESAVLDLYESGFPSAIFLRDKKNIVDLDGSFTNPVSWFTNTINDGKSLSKTWITEDDFISFDSSINLANTTDNSGLKIEYAKKLDGTTAFGARLGLTYNYVNTKQGEEDTDFDKSGFTEFNWLVSLNWEGNGFRVLGTEFGIHDAVAIGNLQRQTPFNMSIDSYGVSTKYAYSYTEVTSPAVTLITDYAANSYGIGLAYVKSISDKALNYNLMMRFNAAYNLRDVWRDYSFSSFSGETLNSGLAHGLFVNAILTARLISGFVSIAVIKSIVLDIEWYEDSLNHLNMQRNEQPLILEAAFVSNIVKIPVTIYNDNNYNTPALSSIGLEITPFNWFDLRAGLKFYRTSPVLITGGVGINLQNFSVDVVYTGSDVLADLKYVF